MVSVLGRYARSCFVSIWVVGAGISEIWRQGGKLATNVSAGFAPAFRRATPCAVIRYSRLVSTLVNAARLSIFSGRPRMLPPPPADDVEIQVCRALSAATAASPEYVASTNDVTYVSTSCHTDSRNATTGYWSHGVLRLKSASVIPCAASVVFGSSSK